jgi:hypothetical protein
MDKEASSLPKTMVSSSTDTGASSKSASIAKGGVKRIRTQDEAAPSPPQERTLKVQYPTYRGVRRRSWGKWVSEIKEPKKKTRTCLGSFDSPEMAARAYDVAEVYLKGKKHALLNFPELIDHIPNPISLHPRHIQGAAAEAAIAFNLESAGNFEWPTDSNKRTRRNPPASNEPSSSSHQLCTGISSNFETASVELSGQTDSSESPSVCTPTECVGDSECLVVEEDLFESFNLLTDLAEALLLSPPPLFSIHEEEHNLEEGFLWSAF